MIIRLGGPGTVITSYKVGKRRCLSITPITFMAVCKDCGANVGAMGEWCMLKNTIWEQVWPGTCQKSTRTKMPMKHNLCIGCIEKRLGRRLSRRDFDLRSKHNIP